MVLKMRHNDADSFDLPKVSVWGFNPLEGQKLKVNHSPTADPRRRRVASTVWGALCLAVIIGLAATSVRAQPEYLLVPGDIVRISVFKNPDLSLDARVSEGGAISYPLIGAVQVAGLTLPGAEHKIAQMLRDGGFVLTPPVNIGDILIVSGSRGGKPFRREIDIVKMQMSGNPSDDIELTGGDTLFVGRAPMFYIYGQVQKPGQVRLERNMTVIQALASGGGVTGKGTSRGIVRHRRDASGKVKEESVSLDDDVRDQDVIYVKESLF